MLRFCNNYPATVQVAIMFYSPETCGGDGGDFEAMGWWRINPGQCATVYGNDLADLNQYWYYYAEADDGARWSGPYPTIIPYRRFNVCDGTPTTDPVQRRRWFRELDIGENDHYTLHLVP